MMGSDQPHSRWSDEELLEVEEYPLEHTLRLLWQAAALGVVPTSDYEGLRREARQRRHTGYVITMIQMRIGGAEQKIHDVINLLDGRGRDVLVCPMHTPEGSWPTPEQADLAHVLWESWLLAHLVSHADYKDWVARLRREPVSDIKSALRECAVKRLEDLAVLRDAIRELEG